jgi:voltage-gated potassium channel Kch
LRILEDSRTTCRELASHEYEGHDWQSRSVCGVHQISAMALLLVAVLASFFTILVHSLLPGVIVRGVRHHIARGQRGFWVWDAILVTRLTLFALAAHFVEISLWALSFVLCGQFSNFALALYYSGVTYTTLGDNTTVLSARWRLLEPIEAANGMLMFGVTTAIIFAVIARLIETKLGLQRDPRPKTG